MRAFMNSNLYNKQGSFRYTKKFICFHGLFFFFFLRYEFVDFWFDLFVVCSSPVPSRRLVDRTTLRDDPTRSRAEALSDSKQESRRTTAARRADETASRCADRSARRTREARFRARARGPTPKSRRPAVDQQVCCVVRHVIFLFKK